MYEIIKRDSEECFVSSINVKCYVILHDSAMYGWLVGCGGTNYTCSSTSVHILQWLIKGDQVYVQLNSVHATPPAKVQTKGCCPVFGGGIKYSKSNFKADTLLFDRYFFNLIIKDKLF